MRNDNSILKKLQSGIKLCKESPHCWEWLLGCNGAGYGQFKWNGEYKLAHREAYYQKYRYIPEGWDVHHRCGNKKCINPSHLVAIPHAENIRRAMKGRIFKRIQHGESNGNSKLFEPEVELIRDFVNAGLTQRQISLLMGVSETTVNNIINGKSWRHLLPKPGENREQNPMETV